MTTELVLLLALYVFILLGGFIGDDGVLQTFSDSTPKFAAKLEKKISIGWRFNGSKKHEWNP